MVAEKADKLEFIEFRLMLVYLRQYFELFIMFDIIDTSDDGIIGRDEFMMMVPMLAKWGVVLEDPAKEFDEINSEINSDGKEGICWDEFRYWCARGVPGCL